MSHEMLRPFIVKVSPVLGPILNYSFSHFPRRNTHSN